MVTGKCGPFPCCINRLLLRQFRACEAHDDAYEFMIKAPRPMPEFRKLSDNTLLTDLLREGCPGWRAVAYWAAARIFGGWCIRLKRRFR